MSLSNPWHTSPVFPDTDHSAFTTSQIFIPLGAGNEFSATPGHSPKAGELEERVNGTTLWSRGLGRGPTARSALESLSYQMLGAQLAQKLLENL